MGEGSYKTFGERNWYENAAVPAAAIPNDPNPSFTKKARRSNSLPDSAGAIFFSSDIGLPRTLAQNAYLGPPAATGDLGRSGPSIDSIEINPVRSAEARLYDSMVMVPTGQRAAQSPQRIQRVSSFSIADPVTMPSSSAATSSNSTPNSSWCSWIWRTVSGSN